MQFEFFKFLILSFEILGVYVKTPIFQKKIQTKLFNFSKGLVFDFFITKTNIYALVGRTDFARGVFGKWSRKSLFGWSMAKKSMSTSRWELLFLVNS